MCALFNNSVLTGVAGGLTQGVQMATMLQYIVGVRFSTHHYCLSEEFHSRMKDPEYILVTDSDKT